MTIVNYFDGDEWSIVDIGREGSFIHTIYRSIICENGKCWVPPPTDLDEHILIIKRLWK
jgi:hypothetical protein